MHPALRFTVPVATAASLLAATQAAPHFPPVEGTNLEKRVFALPAGFDAELNLVFVAFRREQQADVDSWTPAVRELRLADRGVAHYELPTLNRSYRMVRPFIDGGMARGIPDKAVRETTITLYIDKAPFKRALQIDAEDRIVAFLVRRDGTVTWRADGPASPASVESLRAALPPVPATAAPTP